MKGEARCSHGNSGNCLACYNEAIKNPPPEIIDKGMSERFDKEFGWLLQPIKVTPSYGADFEKAKVLQEIYNKTGDSIKSFIQDEIQQALQRERELWLEKIDKLPQIEERGLDGKHYSFISKDRVKEIIGK